MKWVAWLVICTPAFVLWLWRCSVHVHVIIITQRSTHQYVVHKGIGYNLFHFICYHCCYTNMVFKHSTSQLKKYLLQRKMLSFLTLFNTFLARLLQNICTINTNTRKITNLNTTFIINFPFLMWTVMSL